jgi:hypothetical protein
MEASIAVPIPNFSFQIYEKMAILRAPSAPESFTQATAYHEINRLSFSYWQCGASRNRVCSGQIEPEPSAC